VCMASSDLSVQATACNVTIIWLTSQLSLKGKEWTSEVESKSSEYSRIWYFRQGVEGGWGGEGCFFLHDQDGTGQKFLFCGLRGSHLRYLTLHCRA